jgi:hypothetical protein
MHRNDFRRGLAAACSILLLVGQQTALAQDAPEQQFKLVVLRGENAQNNMKKGRATRPVVEVRDRNNNPVAGALVVFTLPSSGPSGTFLGGGQVASVTTNAQGQASASFTANSVPGRVNLNVSTSINGQSVTTQIATYNVLAAGAITGTTLAVILGLVAAGGVGAAVALTRDGGGGSTAPSGIRIGPGTGSVTPPR